MSSKAKKRWIAGATFLAGLYFLLEFIVPPIVPGMAVQGALLSKHPGQIAFLDGGATRVLPLDGETRLQKQKVSSAGTHEPSDVPVRYVAEGDIVDIQRGEEHLAAVRVVRIDGGSLDLLVNGKRQSVSLSGNQVVLRVTRTAQPAEVSFEDLEFGQTLRVGPSSLIKDQRDTAANFTSVLETMAIGMGLLSLAVVNGRRIKRREGDWYTAVFFFGAVVIGVLAGLWKYAPNESRAHEFSDLIIMRVITAVGSTIFSLLAFYLASAAYRAFRVRTAEAALMMASALIVMLGQTPFGMYLTGWMGERFSFLWLPNVAGWMLREPISAVFRGLIFGVMLGAIATALRYWLSLERSRAMGD